MNEEIIKYKNDFIVNKNRDKGHRFELKIINELKQMGFEAVSSRSESKNLDAKGVDIVSNFPMFIQCKFTLRLPDIWKVFGKMPPSKPPVLFWSKAYKDDIVILRKKDFYNLIKHDRLSNGYEIFRTKGDQKAVSNKEAD